MNLDLNMSGPQKARVQMQADGFNEKLKAKGLNTDQDMGKDKYLKLLVTQLKHQDPNSPLKNHEFAAQMAQFSALEQMTKLNSKMENLFRSSRSEEMMQLLGKKVMYLNPASKKTHSGTVRSLSFEHGQPHLNVNGSRVSPENILQVMEAEKKPGSSMQNVTRSSSNGK